MEKVLIQLTYNQVDLDTKQVFTDALYLTEQEYLTITRKDLDALKQTRFNNWKQSFVDAQNAPLETKEEALERIAEKIDVLSDELDALAAEKTGLESKSESKIGG